MTYHPSFHVPSYQKANIVYVLINSWPHKSNVPVTPFIFYDLLKYFIRLSLQWILFKKTLYLHKYPSKSSSNQAFRKPSMEQIPSVRSTLIGTKFKLGLANASGWNFTWRVIPQFTGLIPSKRFKSNKNRSLLRINSTSGVELFKLCDKHHDYFFSHIIDRKFQWY